MQGEGRVFGIGGEVGLEVWGSRKGEPVEEEKELGA